MENRTEQDMKLVAYYLPQFHEIPENNQAWGEGFTEWTNVKKAVPLFEGHSQPREPLGGNYYNLLDIEAMRWQVSLAKKYGLYGFCFYHYRFKDGKMVLEKPVELLRTHPELEIAYCFSWANEPWTRTWHGAAGEKEMLLEQGYGDEGQWLDHFEYLLPYFKDDRYIKIDGRPVFLIYQINKIGCFSRMIDHWETLAVKNGFQGLYIVDMLTSDGKKSNNKRVSASVDFAPGKAQRRKKEEKETYSRPSYSDSYNTMLNEAHKEKEFRCVFVDYDDSPRRGENACIYEGASPQRFGEYLQKTIGLSKEEGNEYVFVNAWNEWGEGNYLEPDKKNGYAYLEALRDALLGNCQDIKLEQNGQVKSKEDKQVEKYRRYYELCSRWIKNTNDGYKIEEYFCSKGYRDIAVYGMGELGNRLVEALENTPVNVRYGIDKSVWAAYGEIEIKGIEEERSFRGIDCIVVTAIHLYDEIAKELALKADCNIISLEDVIYGL